MSQRDILKSGVPVPALYIKTSGTCQVVGFLPTHYLDHVPVPIPPGTGREHVGTGGNTSPQEAESNPQQIRQKAAFTSHCPRGSGAAFHTPARMEKSMKTASVPTHMRAMVSAAMRLTSVQPIAAMFGGDMDKAAEKLLNLPTISERRFQWSKLTAMATSVKPKAARQLNLRK